MKNIETSVIHKNGKPFLIILDYLVSLGDSDESEFRLSYYPHLLDDFTKLLDKTFKSHEKHIIYGDFKPFNKNEDPGFFIHLLQKKS